jgi:hypothetical protein
MYKYWIVFGVIYFLAGLIVLVLGGGLLGQGLQDSVAACLTSRDFVLHHSRLPDKLERRKLVGGSLIVGFLIDRIVGLLISPDSPIPRDMPVWIFAIGIGISIAFRGFVLHLSYGWGARKLFGPRS